MRGSSRRPAALCMCMYRVPFRAVYECKLRPAGRLAGAAGGKWTFQAFEEIPDGVLAAGAAAVDAFLERQPLGS